MFASSNQALLFTLLGTLSMTVIILLAFALMMKMRKAEELNKIIAELKKSLDEMDEQAKLIVRTDLELNKTYEELDHRLNALYALQRISRELSKTLDQSQIFRVFRQEHLQEIGFEKMFTLSSRQNTRALQLKHQIGFSQEEAGEIENRLNQGKTPLLISQIASTFSSARKINKDNPLNPALKQACGLDSFVVLPILKKSGPFGFIILGNSASDTLLTAGDEELATILATQLGQALDNAELFENAYSQHQELEKKVIIRTKELSEALDEIKTVSKRKTDFVSAVSHELRTPLTSIKGYASILLSEKSGPLPQEIKDRLAKINKHSDELVHMVNDLLDIARIESGKFEMKLEPVDLKETAAGIIDLLGPQMKEKGVAVLPEFPARLSPVLADRTQISRVFINIMGNAVKFVPEKSGAIKISAMESGDFVQVNIADNGIGMSDEDARRIFEEFYRVDNLINQKVKGTGLGLTLVKNIIRAHNGKIWVESKLNHGSVFSFALPKDIRRVSNAGHPAGV